MSSSPFNSSLLDLIANGGPLRSVAQNQNLAADTAQRNASTAATTAGIPGITAQGQLAQAQAQQAQTQNQMQQQALKEAELYNQWIIQMAQTPPTFAGSPTGPGPVPNAGQPAPAPPQASPTQIAQSTIPGGLINRTGDVVDGVPSLPQAPLPTAAGTGDLVPGMTGVRTGDLQPGAAPALPAAGVPNPRVQAPPQQPTLTLSSLYDNPVRTALEYAKWAGPRGGGSAPFVQSLIQNGIAMKQKLLELEPQKLKAEQASLQPVVDLLTAVTGLPDGPAKDQAWAQARPEIVKLHPELDQKFPAATPGITNDQLQVPLALAHGLKAALDQQETQQKIKTAQASAEKDTAQAGEFSQTVADRKRAEAAATLAAATSPNEYEAARLRMPASTATIFPSFNQVFDANGKQLPGAADKIRELGMTPDEQVKAQQARAQLAHEQTVSAESARHNRASEANAAAELGVRRAEADPFGALGINPKAATNTGQGLTGEEYLKTLPPQLQPIVHQIATGQQPAITGFALTKPYGQQIMAAVAQYDPTFSADRAHERQAFSSGKQGQNIQALNTATVHLDQLKDAAAALNNGTLVPGNQLYNTITQTFGSAAPTNFEALKNVAAGELANAYKGAATDEEIRNISKTITSAQSPQQLAGTLQTQLHALAAKLNTYDEQYHQKIPNDAFSPVLPSARAVFEKNGIKPLTSDTSRSAVPPSGGHVIELNGKHYQYKGSGATDDIKNYSEVKQ
jgi:hypothetical protein